MKFLERGLEYESADLYVHGNLAHTYLLTGDFERAKQIYLRYAEENIDETTSFKEAVKQDFLLFEEIGIKNPGIQAVRNLLGI